MYSVTLIFVMFCFSVSELPQAFSTPTPEPQISPLVGGGIVPTPGLGLPLGGGIGPVGALGGGGLGSPLGLTSPAFASNQYGLPVNRNNLESSGFNRGGNGFSNGLFGTGSGLQSRRSHASLWIAGLGVFNLMALLV